MPKNGIFSLFGPKISKFKVDALPHGWTYRPDRWLKMTLLTSFKKYEPKFFLPLTILEHWRFSWIAQDGHFLGLLNIKMMKMAKRDPRCALTVLKPCGNDFSAQETYMGSILGRKTSNFGWKCPKKAFFALLDKHFKVQSWCSTT